MNYKNSPPPSSMTSDVKGPSWPASTCTHRHRQVIDDVSSCWLVDAGVSSKCWPVGTDVSSCWLVGTDVSLPCRLVDANLSALRWLVGADGSSCWLVHAEASCSHVNGESCWLVGADVSCWPVDADVSSCWPVGALLVDGRSWWSGRGCINKRIESLERIDFN
jgi:hypothetical protein